MEEAADGSRAQANGVCRATIGMHVMMLNTTLLPQELEIQKRNICISPVEQEQS